MTMGNNDNLNLQIMPEYQPNNVSNDQNNNVPMIMVCNTLAAIIKEQNNQMQYMMKYLTDQEERYQRNEKRHEEFEKELSRQIRELQNDCRRLDNRGIFGRLGDKIDGLFSW